MAGMLVDRFSKIYQHHLRRWPFQDEEQMIGPPDCSEAAFKRPLLRRCPFSLDEISWCAALGGGLDGIFWDAEPVRGFGYFAPQREAQTAALFEKIAFAVNHDTETLPIRVHAQPVGYTDASDSLLAFSTEGRQRQQVKDADAVQVTSMPRMKKCHGWLNIDGSYLQNKLPRRLAAWTVRLRGYSERSICADQKYFAIVYDYIPEGDNDVLQMQQQLDFLWRAGFAFEQSFRRENWKSSILVDWADIVSPVGAGWRPRGYQRTDTTGAFELPPPPPPPVHREGNSDTSSSASRSPVPSFSSSEEDGDGEKKQDKPHYES